MQKLRLLIFILLISNFVQAQSVGLVLSGGGAKGIAHVGVIKVLEEHGIPIDYVAGTSIGAIVGGLYAAGYTPEEMLDLFQSDQFKLWSTGKIDKEDLYYFKRKEDKPDWLKLDLAKKDDQIKLLVPTNLIPERQMDFAFMELMASTNAVCDNNFDKLMVPFRCVSADVYNNKQVVHKSGNLDETIRASMTFPLVFKPIELDGNLLFDGGIINNFPVDVMIHDFNPDIIIGHKVADSPKKPDPDDLYEQIQSMIMQKTNYSIPDSIGVMLETEFPDVGLLDFDKDKYIYQRGIKTINKKIQEIEQRVKRRMTKDEFQERRKAFNSRKADLVFNNVQVEGVYSNEQRKYLIQSIKSKSNKVGVEELRKSYFKLVEDDHIKSIRPLSRYNKNTGMFDLHLKVEPQKPLNIVVGGNISSKPISFGYLGLKYKTFNRQAFSLYTNIYFGRFYSSFNIGARMDLPTNKPFYVLSSVTMNRWDYFNSSREIFFSDIGQAYQVQSENNFKLEMGFPFETTGVVDFGVAYAGSTDEYYQTALFSKTDTPDMTRFNAFTSFIRMENKAFDYKTFPTEGYRKMFELRYIGGNETYSAGSTAEIQTSNFKSNHSYLQITAKYEEYFPINDWFSLGVQGEALFNNKDVFHNYRATLLNAPGFNPTIQSKSLFLGGLHANQYIAGGIKGIFKLNDFVHFRAEGYIFAPVRSIVLENQKAVYSDAVFSNQYYLAALEGVFHSRFGPLSAGINYYDKSDSPFYFYLKFGYLLFNKRGF